MEIMNDLMTRKTLALKLDCSPRTIIRYEKKGLPVIRIGGLRRYDWAEVTKWIELNRFAKELVK